MHVSVIMSVFNGAATLERAVRSIQAQTFSNWELIVVDDASNDKSWELIQKLAAADNRITALRNHQNCGLADSLNRAWKVSKGVYVARMDADDLSLNDRFKRQVDFLDSHPEVAVLGTGVILTDHNGKPIGELFRPKTHAELAGNMYKETPFFHPTVMMRREFLEALNGYDAHFRFGQDTELWLRGYRKFNFHNLQEPLLCYHLSESLSPARVYWAVKIILLSAYREGLLFTKGWYIIPTIAAAVMRWLGFKRAGLNFERKEIKQAETNLGVF